MTRDPWHFRRDELAEQVLGTLARGPAQALSLFAPRRAGKTEFLVQDLAPHAEAQGHRVIYASFWQAPLSPLAVLLHALEKSRERGRLADRIRTSAWRVAPKLKLSASVPGTGTGAEAEIDLTRLKGKPPTNLLLHLDDLLGRVSRRGRPTILLLDEVQELARSRGNASLVAALRTGLDKRRDGLRAVFTGSSRAGLAAMFSDREAPFFHFATPIDLPALGTGFVDHIVAVFQRTAKRTPDRDGMLDAFDRLHRNPYFFRLLVQRMLYDPEHTVGSALKDVRERIAGDLGYPEAWLALTPLQRENCTCPGEGCVTTVQPGLSRGAGCRHGRGCPDRRTGTSGASEAGAPRNCRRRERSVGARGSGVWRVDCRW